MHYSNLGRSASVLEYKEWKAGVNGEFYALVPYSGPKKSTPSSDALRHHCTVDCRQLKPAGNIQIFFLFSCIGHYLITFCYFDMYRWHC